MVYSANRFLSSKEQAVNAQYIMNYLLAKGWTKNAVAGMLGNMQTESTINPGIWQNLSSGNMRLGFGLVQWTPASKYIDWANNRKLDYKTMDANLQRILYEVEHNIQWIKSGMTFKQFTQSTLSPYDLGLMFLSAYERPANPNQPIRGTQAEKWFNTLDGDGDFVPDDGSGTTGGYQLAQFLMDVINVTQGENGDFSHQGELSMDFVGTHSIYPYYAPCDVECYQVYAPDAILYWRTVNPVMCADGKVREFNFRTIHDDVFDHGVGDIVLKGGLLGHTGTGGPASGEHLHLDVWEGLTFTRTNPLHIYDVFSVGGVNIINGGGYPWKVNPYEDGENVGVGDTPQEESRKKTKKLITMLLSDTVNGWKF